MQLTHWFNLTIENGNFYNIVFLFDVFNTRQFDEMMYIVPACAEKTYFGLTAQWQLPPNVFPLKLNNANLFASQKIYI